MSALLDILHRDCDSEGAKVAQAWDERQAREGFRRVLPDAATLHYQLQAARAERDAALMREADLQRQLDTLAGRNATPQAGCVFERLPLGDASVLVEVELPNEDHAGPIALNVLLNGQWLNVDGCIKDSVMLEWDEQLAREMKHDAQCVAEADAMAGVA